jgi:hypothetical protein
MMFLSCAPIFVWLEVHVVLVIYIIVRLLNPAILLIAALHLFASVYMLPFLFFTINSISLNHTLKGIINLLIRATSNSQYILDQI